MISTYPLSESISISTLYVLPGTNAPEIPLIPSTLMSNLLSGVIFTLIISLPFLSLIINTFDVPFTAETNLISNDNFY